MSDESPEVPLYPEEFVGWRGWAVTKKGLLASVNSGAVWKPGMAFEAICSLGKPHKHIPWSSCGCGIYATVSLDKLRSNGYHTIGCLGTVKMWGHAIDGGEGYRTQFAYPDVIYVPYLSWKLIEGLEVYGVPVKLLNPYTGEPE